MGSLMHPFARFDKQLVVRVGAQTAEWITREAAEETKKTGYPVRVADVVRRVLDEAMRKAIPASAPAVAEEEDDGPSLPTPPPRKGGPR